MTPIGTSNIGSEYSADDLIFLKAIDAFKMKHRRMPTDAEVLEIAIAIGYRKVAEPQEPRTYAQQQISAVAIRSGRDGSARPKSPGPHHRKKKKRKSNV